MWREAARPGRGAGLTEGGAFLRLGWVTSRFITLTCPPARGSFARNCHIEL